MTTGDIVRERALELARTETDREQAVSELFESCGGRRVPVVSARQHLIASLDWLTGSILAVRVARLETNQERKADSIERV